MKSLQLLITTKLNWKKLKREITFIQHKDLAGFFPEWREPYLFVNQPDKGL
jgi:hypothetical protein